MQGPFHLAKMGHAAEDSLNSAVGAGSPRRCRAPLRRESRAEACFFQRRYGQQTQPYRRR